MNWTEGNLHRHARGRGWSRDRSRQKQVFASARAGKTPSAPNKSTATGEASPFFSIGALKEPSLPPEPKADVASPPHTKRRKISPVASHPGNDLEARRRRLLERSDWTGISSDRALRRDSVEAVGQISEPSHHATPSPQLHHPKPVRRDGAQLIQSLESHTCSRSEATPSSRRGSSPSDRSGPSRAELNPYPRAAASVGTAETEDTDNLLPLSDTLPDVSVRLDILEPVGITGRDGHVSGEEEDISLTALLSSLSDDSSSKDEGVSMERPEAHTLGRGSQKRRGSSIPEEKARGGEDNWLDFIFDDGEDEEELMMQAFEIATRDAARVLVPSDWSGGSRVVECDSGSGCGGSDRATCGTAS